MPRAARKRFLGRTIGGTVTRLAAVFDADAEDGDGDGMVQDGTRWQRAARASARIAKRISSLGGLRNNEPGSRPKRNRSAAGRMNRVWTQAPFEYDQFNAPMISATLGETLQDRLQNPEQWFKRFKINRPRRDASTQVETMQEKQKTINSFIEQKFGEIKTKRQAIIALTATFPNLDLSSLRNSKFDNDLTTHQESLVKTLLYLGSIDKNTAAGILEINFLDIAKNQEGQRADAGDLQLANLATGVHPDGRFGSSFNFFHVPKDDRHKYTLRYLELASRNDKQIGWHPESKAIIQMAVELFKPNNNKTLEEKLDIIDYFRAASLVAHEWGHAAHNNSIWRKEFGLTNEDFTIHYDTVADKLFPQFSKEQKQYMMFYALLDGKLNETLETVQRNMNPRIPILDQRMALEETEQDMRAYFTGLMEAMITNANKDLADKLFTQLDEAAKSFKNDFGIDLQAMQAEIFRFIDTMITQDIFDFSDYTQFSTTAFSEFLDARTSANQPTWLQKISLTEFARNMEYALQDQLAALSEVKILDTLSAEDTAHAVKNLPNVSFYSSVEYARWRKAVENKGSLNLQALSPLSYGTAVSEGIAELYLAMFWGFNPKQKGPEKMMDFITTKQSVKNETSKSMPSAIFDLLRPKNNLRSECNFESYQQGVDLVTKPAESNLTAKRRSKD